MKRLEIIIPHRRLDDVNEIVKSANTGGMSHYRIEGRGKVKAQEVAVGRGTMKYTPEYIPRTKVEVVIKDDQVESLINNKLRFTLETTWKMSLSFNSSPPSRQR